MTQIDCTKTGQTRKSLATESRQPATPARSMFPPLSILLVLTIAAQLINLAFGRINAEQSLSSVLLPSLLFLCAITLPLTWLGIRLGPKVGLGIPLIDQFLANQPTAWRILRNDVVFATILGLALGALLLLVRVFSTPYLPPELPAFGHRGILGGLAVSVGAAVAEEVWFRLGLMTVLVWIASKAFSKGEVQPVLVWSVIAITSIGFGTAHLPQLVSYGAGSPFAITGTVLGNTAVGFLYGWCYWRRSLIAAIVAHFSVDIVLHVLPVFFK
ncbi:MAG: CPBP family intramembrane glutamic endopeptidase [Calditrichia bacterium]